MSAAEWWFLVAVIAAAVAAVMAIAVVRAPTPADPLARAVASASVGRVAVGLWVALP